MAGQLGFQPATMALPAGGVPVELDLAFWNCGQVLSATPLESGLAHTLMTVVYVNLTHPELLAEAAATEAAAAEAEAKGDDAPEGEGQGAWAGWSSVRAQCARCLHAGGALPDKPIWTSGAADARGEGGGESFGVGGYGMGGGMGMGMSASAGSEEGSEAGLGAATGNAAAGGDGAANSGAPPCPLVVVGVPDLPKHAAVEVEIVAMSSAVAAIMPIRHVQRTVERAVEGTAAAASGDGGALGGGGRGHRAPSTEGNLILRFRVSLPSEDSRPRFYRTDEVNIYNGHAPHATRPRGSTQQRSTRGRRDCRPVHQSKYRPLRSRMTTGRARCGSHERAPRVRSDEESGAR